MFWRGFVQKRYTGQFVCVVVCVSVHNKIKMKKVILRLRLMLSGIEFDYFYLWSALDNR